MCPAWGTSQGRVWLGFLTLGVVLHPSEQQMAAESWTQAIPLCAPLGLFLGETERFQQERERGQSNLLGIQ